MIPAVARARMGVLVVSRRLLFTRKVMRHLLVTLARTCLSRFESLSEAR